MSKTEFSIWLYIHISSAIESFFLDYDDKTIYDGYYLSIEKSDELKLDIPYNVSVVTIENADYRFMPKVMDLIEYYADEETGRLMPVSCVKAISDFMDRWMAREDVQEVIKNL